MITQATPRPAPTLEAAKPEPLPGMDAEGDDRIFILEEIRPGTWTYELDRGAFHRASAEELREQWVELLAPPATVRTAAA